MRAERNRRLLRRWIETNCRGRIFEAKAELRGRADELLASATGKYLPIAEGDVRKMAADFVGDPRAVLDL